MQLKLWVLGVGGYRVYRGLYSGFRVYIGFMFTLVHVGEELGGLWSKEPCAVFFTSTHISVESGFSVLAETLSTTPYLAQNPKPKTQNPKPYAPKTLSPRP